MNKMWRNDGADFAGQPETKQIPELWPHFVLQIYSHYLFMYLFNLESNVDMAYRPFKSWEEENWAS